jgi:gluconate 5-dehydrogenase
MVGALFDLTGYEALVTGASTGLGFEAARVLALAGARVWVNGRAAASVDAAVAQITAEGGKATSLVFDVADEAAAGLAFVRVQQEAGRLDVLVNNVGLRDRRPLFAFELSSVRRLVEVDLIAPFDLARRAARLMIDAKRGGRIINLSSIAGPLAGTDDTPYTMAKAGIDGLTRALAAELGSYGITVNAVAPGFFRTKPNAELAKDPAVNEWLKARTSLGRWGEPRELAPVILFFASDAASYVTGQVLAVDGGYLSHF